MFRAHFFASTSVYSLAPVSESELTETGGDEIFVDATVQEILVEEEEDEGDEGDKDEFSSHSNTANSFQAEVQSHSSVLVVPNGGAGQPTQVFVRGSNSSDFPIIYDGFALGDPSSVNRTLDYSLFGLGLAQDLEVRPGVLGVEYGPTTTSGAIVVKTKKPRAKPELRFKQVLGSQSTFVESLRISGGSQKWVGSIEAKRFDTGGISAASEDNGNSERDSHRSTEVALRSYAQISPQIKWNLGLDSLFSKTDLDGFDFSTGPTDDLNYRNESTSIRAQSQLEAELLSGWKQGLHFQYARLDRKYLDDPNLPTLGESSFRSRHLQSAWKHEVKSSDILGFRAGLEFERERLNQIVEEEKQFSENHLSSYSGFRAAPLKALWVSGGIRGEWTQGSDSAFLFRSSIGGEVPATKTKVELSGGSGVKRPSLFQRFDPAFGNPDLVMEKNRSIELSLKQPLKDAQFETAFFLKSIENYIDFDFLSSRYSNVGRQRVSGQDFSLLVNWTAYLSSKTGYTLLFDPLLRRPKHKVTQSLQSEAFQRKLKSRLSLRYISARDDQNAFAETVTLEPYRVVDFDVAYQVAQNFKVFTALNNLFNEDYEAVFGYGTPGRSFFSGLEVVW